MRRAGGACGFGDLGKQGYGMATVGLSTALFERGEACGGCYEVRCVENLKYCLPGTSIVVTATNFCAPNYGLPADAGGHCNPPNHHFLLPIQAFEKIALWKAGVMPIQYRRYVSFLAASASARSEVIFPESTLCETVKALADLELSWCAMWNPRKV
jgi:hypothetical protein